MKHDQMYVRVCHDQMYVRPCLIAMIDVWLGMIDAMLGDQMDASVCVSWNNIIEFAFNRVKT